VKSLRAPLVCVIAASALTTAQAQPPVRLETADPACQSPVLVSTGGAAPRDRHTLAIRWTGYSNFELAYNGQVILLDAYFDRGSQYPPLGFKAGDVRKANVILIGHGHFDHVADAASVGARTGATVVGAPVTIEWLRTQPIDPKQLRTVNGRGGETLRFEGFAVEPILARHGEPPANVRTAFNRALREVAPAPTTEQTAEQRTIGSRGTSDPRVVAEGTIAYVITLDTGFRILYRDSGGTITDFEKAAASRIGPVNLVLAATSAAFTTTSIVQQAMEYVRAYKPSAFIPAHHDAPADNLWRPTEPIFQAIHDENPDIITISKGYRQPTCFVTERTVPR
jgi:L-ascorbate metabolism protein UlaG (beta-lactamase superfamily)